ncbi:hypothetical protein, partial [Schaalia odontolytica]
MTKKQAQQPSQMQTLTRLLKYVYRVSPAALIVSLVSVIISAAASVVGSLFIEQVIDRYITPMLKQKSPDFGPLAHAV